MLWRRILSGCCSRRLRLARRSGHSRRRVHRPLLLRGKRQEHAERRQRIQYSEYDTPLVLCNPTGSDARHISLPFCFFSVLSVPSVLKSFPFVSPAKRIFTIEHTQDTCPFVNKIPLQQLDALHNHWSFSEVPR